MSKQTHSPRELMARDILQATWTPKPWQYSARGNGGVDGAISAAAQNISEGYVWVCVADIKDCFHSFDGEKVARLLPIPKEVTRHTIMADGLVCVPKGFNPSLRTYAHPGSSPRRAEGELTGLPQGSAASSIVADMLLDDLDQAISPACRLISNVDDILIMARTYEEVIESKKALCRWLRSHRSGRLGLKKSLIIHADQGIDFLGQSIFAAGESEPAIIVPTGDRHQRIMDAVMEAFRSDLRAKRDIPEEARRAYECRSSPLWWAHWHIYMNNQLGHLERLLRLLNERERAQP